MSHLQHDRITVLAQDLRLTALPDLYGPIAQTAANKKDPIHKYNCVVFPASVDA